MTTSTDLQSTYVPFKPAAISCAMICGVLTFFQIRGILTCGGLFGLGIMTAGIFDTVGLIKRAISSGLPIDEGSYLVQYILILIAPVLMSAAIYSFLGRLVELSGHPQVFAIRPSWFTKIVVGAQSICFLLQAIGAGQIVDGKTASHIPIGAHLVTAGLCLQTFFDAMFAMCAIAFHMRISEPRFIGRVDPSLWLHWKLRVLYVCHILVLARTLFRMFEHRTDMGSYLRRHEWPTYALDVIPMMAIMVLTLVWYSGHRKRDTVQPYAMDSWRVVS